MRFSLQKNVRHKTNVFLLNFTYWIFVTIPNERLRIHSIHDQHIFCHLSSLSVFNLAEYLLKKGKIATFDYWEVVMAQLWHWCWQKAGNIVAIGWGVCPFKQSTNSNLPLVLARAVISLVVNYPTRVMCGSLLAICGGEREGRGCHACGRLTCNCPTVLRLRRGQ